MQKFEFFLDDLEFLLIICLALDLFDVEDDREKFLNNFDGNGLPAELSDVPVKCLTSIQIIVFLLNMEIIDFEVVVKYFILNLGVVLVDLESLFFSLLLLLRGEGGSTRSFGTS